MTKQTQYNREYRAKNPFKSRIHKLRERASRSKTPMELTAEYIESIFPADKLCPVLKIPLIFTQGETRSRDNIPTMARIDFNKGYVPGNVMWISFKAHKNHYYAVGSGMGPTKRSLNPKTPSDSQIEEWRVAKSANIKTSIEHAEEHYKNIPEKLKKELDI